MPDQPIPDAAHLGPLELLTARRQGKSPAFGKLSFRAKHSHANVGYVPHAREEFL